MMDNKKWYQTNGPDGDVVISTRIRLARNLRDTPFPNQLDKLGKKRVYEKVQGAIESLGFEDFQFINMENLLMIDALSLVEHHLISPEFAFEREGRALLLNCDESKSIMINEEDHIRLQVMSSGSQLDENYDIADSLDCALDNALAFAFNDNLGYLTQCPTNLGTGMRASLMLHLPALQEHNAIRQIANTVSKLGLTIRGLYGEGSRSEGAIYQLSNQVTLGISEKAATDNLKGIAKQIIHEERIAREKLVGNLKVEDLAWRSLGLLKTARLLPQNEFMSLISNVRIGIALGIIADVTYDTVNALLCDAQPSSVMSESHKEMNVEEQDFMRAKIVRDRL